jgi:TrmH family RNA methyltransferase
MWDVADPGNAGTIIRSAAAFGFQVVATAGCVDLWSPKVVRAGVGGHFRTSIVAGFGPVPRGLVEAGLRPFVAEAGGATSPEAMVGTSGPVALIVGNEARGTPAAVVEELGVEALSLAMPGGTESLNAAVAASILMYLRSAR